MKKAKFLALLLMFLGAGFVSSCGDDDDDDVSGTETVSDPYEMIVGTWKGGMYTFTFQSNGTGSGQATSNGNITYYTFPWRIAGNRVICEATCTYKLADGSYAEPSGVDLEFVLSGNVLKLGNVTLRK